VIFTTKQQRRHQRTTGIWLDVSQRNKKRRARPLFRVVICTGPSTLLARIEAVVGHRRREEPRDFEPLMVGELTIRRDQYQAFVGGTSLRLTRREFELVELLARGGGETFERELICTRLWGPAGARNDRTLDVFVHKLRRKLERASPGWRYVHTHWGHGYCFAAEQVGGPCVAASETPRPEPEPVLEPSSARLAA